MNFKGMATYTQDNPTYKKSFLRAEKGMTSYESAEEVLIFLVLYRAYTNQIRTLQYWKRVFKALD